MNECKSPLHDTKGDDAGEQVTNDEEKAKPIRRSTRRLHADAAAYKPTEDDHDSSEEETRRAKGKRKPAGVARKKRGRPADEEGGENAERPATTAKRRKVAAKTSPSW